MPYSGAGGVYVAKGSPVLPIGPVKSDRYQKSPHMAAIMCLTCKLSFVITTSFFMVLLLNNKQFTAWRVIMPADPGESK